MSDFSTADGLMFDPTRPRYRRGGCGGGGIAMAAAGASGVFAPLVIGGALAVVALAGQSRVGQWLRGFLSAGDVVTRRQLRARRAEGGLIPPHRLREMILGRSKASVAARFGPPRTAVMHAAARSSNSSGGIPSAGPSAFWRADTWYYAFDPATQTAVAVRFENDVARAVEFFEAPREET
jgi:hypothetical protein